MNFKIDDRVKCVDAHESILVEDTIYTITDTLSGRQGVYAVKVNGIDVWYLAKRFELVQEEVATSNDIKDLQHQIDILKNHVELMQCELNQLNPPKYWSSNIPGVIGMKYVQDEASLWGGA